MLCIARFEKVSFSQFAMDYVSNIGEIDSDACMSLFDKIHSPSRATKGSAGYDFYSPIDFTLEPGDSITIPTGIKCFMLERYMLSLYVRSSMGFKYKLRLCNTVGIIDSDYYNNKNNEGHIMIKLSNEGNKTLEVKAGDRICQGVFTQYFLAEEVPPQMTRTGGMGSTDKNIPCETE